MASMDKNKTQSLKDYNDSYSNHMSKSHRPSHGLKKGASRSGALAPMFEKSATELKQKQKIT